jgi:transposase
LHVLGALERHGLPCPDVRPQSTVIRTGNRWTVSEALVGRIRALEGEGKSKHEIAATLGISMVTVNRALKCLREPPGPGAAAVRSQRIRARVARVKALKDEGKSDYDIAVMLGISPTTVAKAMKQVREQGGPDAVERRSSGIGARVARIRALKDEGKTNREIARSLGVALSTVGRTLRRMREQPGGEPTGPREVRAPSPRVEELDGRVKALKDEGRSAREIAAILGINVVTVYRSHLRWRCRNGPFPPDPARSRAGLPEAGEDERCGTRPA